jgi:hypothetical protein
MVELNTVEEKKVRIRQLLKLFKECEPESDEEKELYIEIDSILMPIVKSIIENGLSDYYLVEVEKLEPKFLHIPENGYNAVFIEDIAISLKNGKYNNMPEKDFLRIVNVLEHMIDNNIRSYTLADRIQKNFTIQE